MKPITQNMYHNSTAIWRKNKNGIQLFFATIFLEKKFKFFFVQIVLSGSPWRVWTQYTREPSGNSRFSMIFCDFFRWRTNYLFFLAASEKKSQKIIENLKFPDGSRVYWVHTRQGEPESTIWTKKIEKKFEIFF